MSEELKPKKPKKPRVRKPAKPRPPKPTKTPEELKEDYRRRGEKISMTIRAKKGFAAKTEPKAIIKAGIEKAKQKNAPGLNPQEPTTGSYEPTTNSQQSQSQPQEPLISSQAIDALDPKVKLEMAKRTLARRSLIQFTKRFYPVYNPGWVHHDIARRLEHFMQQVEERKSPRLMLLVPPRHGKSELASIRFPAFALGHHPEWEIINCGYNLDLPMKFSRRVREIVRDPGYAPLFERTAMDPDSQSAEAWNTTMGGGFTAAGVGGGITGKGATILTIDDPIKNQEEADSIVTRDGLWDWYWSTAYTRLAPGGGVLIIQTWWHDDDLAGRIQQKMRDDPDADQFVIIKYPALSEAWEYRNLETDLIERYDAPFDENHEAMRQFMRKADMSVPSVIDDKYELLRMPGEALHPERYNEKMMTAMKANQPPRIWSALFQQNPVPDEGMYFRKDYFKFESVPPAAYQRNVYQAWDFAIGEKQVNDFTVGVTLIQDENDFLHVVEVVRFKGDSFVIIEEILNAAERWGSEPTAPLTLGFEDSQIWKAIKPLLEKRMAERNMYPPYEVLRPLTDKLARSRSLQGRMQQGRVYFPQNAPWLNDLMTEFLRFPAAAHDDMVDAMAWAVNLCVNRAPKQQPKAKGPVSWKEKLNSHLMLSGDGYSHMAS